MLEIYSGPRQLKEHVKPVAGSRAALLQPAELSHLKNTAGWVQPNPRHSSGHLCEHLPVFRYFESLPVNYFQHL